MTRTQAEQFRAKIESAAKSIYNLSHTPYELF